MGNYKKKLGIKREKAPFVLTPDFAYVMGGRDSRDFKTFCDKCCKGYNILRKHSNMFINLFCMVRWCSSRTVVVIHATHACANRTRHT